MKLFKLKVKTANSADQTITFTDVTEFIAGKCYFYIKKESDVYAIARSEIVEIQSKVQNLDTKYRLVRMRNFDKDRSKKK